MSASIDFCEENYYITPYIAEFHNTWSSLLMMIPPFIGLLYSNPTYEWRTTILFTFLMFCFLGSVFLHFTLKDFEQSTDEVSMLLYNNAVLYSLSEYKIMKKRVIVISTMILISIIQINIYYTFQHLYYMFLLQFIPLSIINLIWCGYISIIHNKSLYNKLYIYFISSYLFAGALWIFEIYNCNSLLPYYRMMNGCTLHIIWHIGSGLGGYFVVLFITSVRLEVLGGTPELKWIGGICPVVVNNAVLFNRK